MGDTSAGVTKKVKVSKSEPDYNNAASFPEDLMEIIQTAQKESIWKLLEDKKIECSRLKERLEMSSNELLEAKEQLHKALNTWNKLLEKLRVNNNPDDDAERQILSVMSSISSSVIEKNAQSILKEGEFDGHVKLLLEERQATGQLLTLKEEELLQTNKRIKRLEFQLAKQGTKRATVDDLEEKEKPSEPSDSHGDTILIKELESLKKVLAGRLEEMENMEKTRCDMRQENLKLLEQLRRVPEELLNNPSSLRQIDHDIQGSRFEISRRRHQFEQLESDLHELTKKRKIFEADLDNHLQSQKTECAKFLDDAAREALRMRKERDNMREIYEHANGQVNSANKTIINLQGITGKLEERLNAVEEQQSRLDKIISHLNSLTSQEESTKNDIDSVTKLFVENDIALYKELEVLGSAYDELQGQNKMLIKNLKEQEDAYSKLLSEKLHAEFNVVQLKKEVDLTTQKANELERVSINRIDKAEKKEAEARIVIAEVESKAMQKLLDAEKTQMKLFDVSEEYSRIKRQLESFLNSKIEHRLTDATRALEKASFDNKRLQEELGVTQTKLKAYAETGRVPQKDMNEELQLYRKLMKCNSCHIRDKNAVITKCMHVFCRQCLDSRIETRQRKCPNCGDPFGVSDVRNIYL